ncbi:bifunctional diaminohydroxyphosphoribosylaminopyrimidine deaminase/5-amino-6-(5-phosphoribosylamino)uracil reductase RibD [Maricaulis sp. CAU 1757]
MPSPADSRYMDLALALASSQLGRTAPNPSVGCVLVRDERILATGATADGGRPHAEAVALAKAGTEARGATAYVTLEPCAFEGRSGACSVRLIHAGIARVVIAALDRHPQVNGAGLDQLQAAGIRVETGLRSAAAEALYAGFFHRLETGRPLVYADRNPARYDGVLDATATKLDAAALDAELDRRGARGENRISIDPRLAPDLARPVQAHHTVY